MPENQHFCPKCGAGNKADAKFCRSCGEKLSPMGNSGAETLQKAADMIQTVSSTVSKVESAVGTAGKIVQSAGELSGVVIRPPAEWEVVVGDMLPVAGQKMVESAVVTLEKQVQQQVGSKVQEEVARQVEKAIQKPQPAPTPKPFVQPPSPVVVTPVPSVAKSHLPVCPSCGNPLTPGKKFCGSCGKPVGVSATHAPVPVAPPAPVCPSCGNPLTPGKKFCGSCGRKLL